MDQDEAFDNIRKVEEILTNTLQNAPGFRVEQCQWVFGKRPGESNLINAFIRVDPEAAFAPPPPEREMIAGEEQDTFNSMFESIVSGKTVDEHEERVLNAREEAKQALQELEDDI